MIHGEWSKIESTPQPKSEPATQPEWSRSHELWYSTDLFPSTSHDESKREVVKDYNNANLISSSLVESEGLLHRPVLDFDFSCVLIPSSTPGHFHLVIQKTLTLEKYSKLLQTLNEIGLIEDGVYKRFLNEKRTYIRRPGDRK